MKVVETRIISSLSTVIASRTGPDLVALWSACRAIELEGLGPFPVEQLNLYCPCKKVIITS